MDSVDSTSRDAGGGKAPDPRIGTSIGPYLIEALLGRGGMGIVYLAHHERLDRKVALKVLAPEWSEDPSFRDRFVRESRTAASLDHPNVIPVFDADEADGLLYIAMRYVAGRDLKEIITSEGHLELPRAIRMVRQIGGALDAAHERGLVHRDVKPANVLVTKDDGSAVGEHVYLTDFGLSKHRSSKSAHTAAGAFVGTIDYIAPEQIEGKALDNRTDIYSLGCILYECLTGETPFIKDADVAVMYAHLMDPRPSVTAKRPDLPSAIDDITAKAMARDPEERYVTGAALLEDLNALVPGAAAATSAVITLDEPPVAVPTRTPTDPPPTLDDAPSDEPSEETVPPRRRLGRKTMALGAAAVLLLAAAAYLLTRDDGTQSGDKAGAAAPTGPPSAYVVVDERGLHRVTLEEGAEPQPIKDLLPPAPKSEDHVGSVSHNGEWFVFDTERLGCEGYVCLVTTHDGTDLELVQIGPEPVHTSGSAYSAISSDGETVVYPDDAGPHEVDLWATTRARIAWNDPVLLTRESTTKFNDLPAFSFDDSKVIFDCRPDVYDPAGSRICEVGVDGSGFRTVLGPDDGEGVTKDSYVRHGAYAPDGSIVFEAFWKEHRQIWRLKDGGEMELINPTYDEDTSPCVLPDGTIVSNYERDLKVMSPDGVDVKVIEMNVTEDEYLDSRITCG
jgi:serine/threonine-protein kinase